MTRISISRRRFGRRVGTICSLALVAGCNELERADESTPTEAGVTPSFERLDLEVINSTDHEFEVSVRMTTALGPATETATPGRVLYDDSVQLAPTERLDLTPYRMRGNIELTVSVESNVVYETTVDPYTGHTISIVSVTDVEVETVVV
jgi:hypothetical protein